MAINSRLRGVIIAGASLAVVAAVGIGVAVATPSTQTRYVTATAGTGDSAPMPGDHPLAVGPSRFVLEDRTWKNIAAPTSTTAG